MTDGSAGRFEGSDEDAYRTAFAFLHDLRSRAAERVEAVALGTALWHERLARVGDVNGLIVSAAGDHGADELRRASDALHGDRAERQVVVGERLAVAIAPDMRAAGWQLWRYVVMVRRHEPTRTPIGIDAAVVVEASSTQVRPIEREVEYALPNAGDAETIEQLLDYNDARRALARGRCFVADGASACTLFSDGRVAQVESVVTLPHARGCGLASAVVLAAADAAARDHALTFIVADADDWPREIYARLGFAAVGTFASFSPAG